MLVEGICRGEAVQYLKSEPYFECSVKMIYDEKDFDEGIKMAVEAYMRDLKSLSGEYFSLVGSVPDEVDISFAREKDPSRFSDILCAAFMIDLEEKQRLLEEFNLLDRFQKCWKLCITR